MFLKKGTQVKVITGKDKGKTGEILEINRKLNKHEPTKPPIMRAQSSVAPCMSSNKKKNSKPPQNTKKNRHAAKYLANTTALSVMGAVSSGSRVETRCSSANIRKHSSGGNIGSSNQTNMPDPNKYGGNKLRSA